MKKVSITAGMMKFQVWLSAMFIAIGVAFPLYIGVKYGAGNFPLYDHFGSVIGEANYLVMSFGIGLFAIAIGVIGVLMALNALKKMRPKS